MNECVLIAQLNDSTNSATLSQSNSRWYQTQMHVNGAQKKKNKINDCITHPLIIDSTLGSQQTETEQYRNPLIHIHL